MQTEDERVEAEVAAQKRRDLRASLERERDGYKTRGLDDRASQVEEQLRLITGQDDGTEQGPSDSEERAASAPQETAVESKPRRTAARGSGKS